MKRAVRRLTENGRSEISCMINEATESCEKVAERRGITVIGKKYIFGYVLPVSFLRLRIFQGEKSLYSAGGIRVGKILSVLIVVSMAYLRNEILRCVLAK